MNRIYECSRCGEQLNPEGGDVEQNAKYVIGGKDLVEKEEREVLYALLHNDKTKKECKRISKKEDINEDQASYMIADNRADKIGKNDLEKVEVSSPEEVKQRENFIRCESSTELKERRKKALVCETCVKNSDEIIW